MGVSEDSKRLKALVIASADFSIMVWGSGEGNPFFYTKRVQIRDAIQEKFKRTEPFFPEDKEDAYPELEDMKDKEAAMVAAAGAVLALETTDGPRQEVARYCDMAPWKIFIMIDKKYENSQGYAMELRKDVDQTFYTEKQLTDCDLVGLCLRFIRKRAYKKFLRLDPVSI